MLKIDMENIEHFFLKIFSFTGTSIESVILFYNSCKRHS